VTHDDFGRKRPILVFFTNNQDRLPNFLRFVPDNRLTDGNRQPMGFYAQLPIGAGITMNLELGVIHLFLPRAELDVTSGNPHMQSNRLDWGAQQIAQERSNSWLRIM
jgi:hypothetical protein